MVSPLTRVCRVACVGSNSSAVTMTGPTGVDLAQILPCSHSFVRNCHSRIEMSLAAAYPAMY